MNYLAHAFLSGADKEMLIGGLIADYVRGRPEASYGPGICRGIMLHRRLDAFTDEHPLFRQSAGRVWPRFRHYAGVIMDVFYDHLLARNFARFAPAESLADFAGRANRSLHNVIEAIPAVFHERSRNLNWLTGYVELDSVRKALERLSARSRRKVDLVAALEDLQAHDSELELDFLGFFPKAIAFAAQEQKSLTARGNRAVGGL